MTIPTSSWIWMDDRWLAWDDATVHVSAHALHYGSSAFEGVRVYDGPTGPMAFRLRAHLERFFTSCRLLRMPLERHSIESLTDVAHELVRRNAHDACYIRPIAFRNAGSLGVNGRRCSITVAMLCFPWGRYLGEEAIEQGIDAAVSSWRRFGSSTMLPLGKIGGQYVNNQLATMEASDNGFDEAIMLDAAGNVCEGSGENLFLVRGRTLSTPPMASAILGGITRDAVITLAHDQGLTVRFETISRDMLYVCDELFMTGTAAEITPVRSVDRLPVSDGTRGPITRRLQEAFFGVVTGALPDRHGWLTSVTTDSTSTAPAARRRRTTLAEPARGATA